MVLQALEMMKLVFASCADWTNQLLTATAGSGIILSVFCIVMIIGVLFMPLRGGKVLPSYDSLSDFASQATYRGKFSKNAKKPNYSKMGKFEKGNRNARIERNVHNRTI